MELRRAVTADAEAIRAIYNREVLTATVTFDLVERSLVDQTEWLAARDGAHAVLVCTDEDDNVIGFGSLSPYRDRPAYRTTVEDSIYVDRNHQGIGVGRLVLEGLVDTARDHGFHSVIGRIVGGHDASIALHQKCGFEVVGTEREVGRKFNTWLDVVIVQKLI